MWVSKAALAIHTADAETIGRQNIQLATYAGENTQLKLENARLIAERVWFQHRLTQVEHERGMLMQDKLGVKISVPQFIPATDQSEEQAALHTMPDLSTIGGDAHDDGGPLPDAEPNPGIDYSLMPGYKGK